jgi:hemin uptake protein HemP
MPRTRCAVARDSLYLWNANRYYSHVDTPTVPVSVQQGAAPEAKAAHRRITSAELFAGARELIIEHHGRLYLLRITQNGKLILTA